MFFLFWALLLFVYCAFWLSSLIIFLVGRAKKSRLMFWFGGVPLVLLSLAGVSIVAAEANSYFHPDGPEVAYKAFFGLAPSADVTQMQVSDDAFGDYETTYLAFNASPATIRKITAKGWKAIPPRQCASDDFSSYRGSDAPSWWMPVKTRSSRVYIAHKRVGQFKVVEDETLIYDEASGRAFYCYDGLE